MSNSKIPITNQQNVLAERTSHTDGVSAQPDIVYVQAVNPINIGEQALYRPDFLRASASPAMNVDGSTTPVNFELLPATDEIIRVERLRMFMRCAAAITFTGFGNLAALTNGITLSKHDGTAVISDLLGGAGGTGAGPIQTTEDLLPYVERFELLDSSLVLVAEFKIPPIRLVGTQRLRWTVADDLTGLTELRVLAEAILESTLT